MQIFSALQGLQLLYPIVEKHYPVLGSISRVGIQPEVRALVVASFFFFTFTLQLDTRTGASGS